MLRNFIAVFLLFAVLFVSAQIKIVEGVANKVDGKASHFNILGLEDDKMYVFNTRKNAQGNVEYYLQIFSKSSQYTLENEAEVIVENSQVEGNLSLEIIQRINNKIYIILGGESKKNKTAYYYAAVYDLAFNRIIPWKEIHTHPTGNATIGDFTGSYTSRAGEFSAYYDAEDEVFILHISSYDEAEKKFARHYEYLDLELDFVDSEYKTLSEKLFADDKDETINIWGMGSHTISNKKLFVYTQSSNSMRYQTISFKLVNSNFDVKYNYGLLTKLKDELYVKKLNCYYDSANNDILVSAFYFNPKAKHLLFPEGVLMLKYSCSLNKLVAEKYVKFTNENLTELRTSKYWENLTLNFYNYKTPAFKIIKRNDGSYLYWADLLTVSKTVNYEKKYNTFSTSCTYGSFIGVTFDNNGNETGQFFSSRFTEQKLDFLVDDSWQDYISFEKNNKRMWVFTDNAKNYTNGLYNGKSKSDDEENRCLALLSIDEKGQWERKILINSINEFNVSLLQTSVLKINENEYAWMGFKDGVAKVITLTLE